MHVRNKEYTVDFQQLKPSAEIEKEVQVIEPK